MKALPNMTVLVPCDANQTFNATLAAAEHNGPVYLRYGRPKMPNFTDINEPFIIGKAQILNEGSDVSIIATGHMVWEAIQAALALEKEGVSAEVINIHTIKPLDSEAIIASARKTGAVVTCEEHSLYNGLTDSVAHVLSTNCPTLMSFVAMEDRFGESGTPAQLLEHFGLKSGNIVNAAHKVLKMK